LKDFPADRFWNDALRVSIFPVIGKEIHMPRICVQCSGILFKPFKQTSLQICKKKKRKNLARTPQQSIVL